MPDDDFEPYWIEGRPANELAREMLNTAHRMSLRRMRICRQAPRCPKCRTEQVQLTDCRPLAAWKCRHCKHKWRHEPLVSNVKWTAYSPSILGNSHLSWLALQSKRASLSGFEMGAAIYFRGWMAVKHGARPEYAALAPYSPGSCRLFWPTWRLRRCLSYG